MKYNFDQSINRAGTHTMKLDLLPEGAPEDVLSLWIADMDFPCAEPVIQALHDRVDKKIFGYTRYDNDELKSAVQSWFGRRYGWNIDPATLFFSPGIVPALAFLINILTDAGDGIIIQRPVYYPFSAKIESNDRKVVNSSLIREGDTYVMDYADLEQKFADPGNKGMILCNPHNPVGRVWSEEELKRLAAIAEKYDKWIISDEIHCDLTRIGITYTPLMKAAPDYHNRIIVCTAPSKTFNLAGMQFSNLVITNPEYQKLWLDYVDNRHSLAICSPFGLTSIIAAYNDGEEWLEQIREYLDANIKYVEAFVAEKLPRANVVRCEGTYLIWIDVREYCSDHKKLEEVMLKEARLALDEGYIFGDEGIGYERINIASPRSIIEECMVRFQKGLEHLTD